MKTLGVYLVFRETTDKIGRKGGFLFDAQLRDFLLIMRFIHVTFRLKVLNLPLF